MANGLITETLFIWAIEWNSEGYPSKYAVSRDPADAVEGNAVQVAAGEQLDSLGRSYPAAPAAIKDFLARGKDSTAKPKRK